MVEETESGGITGPETADADLPEEAEHFEQVEPAGIGDRDGPPDDQEMPLTAHIEEMILRFALVLLVAGVVTAVVFPFAERFITGIWYSIIPRSVPPEAIEANVQGFEDRVTAPRVYGPLELLFTELKLAMLAGFVAALPVFVYQTYRFMRPGLYPHERRYYLAAVPTSLVLAFVGISFAYFLVLPAIFSYFLYYSTNAGLISFALKRTFDLILVMMGYMALVFQIPLFIMLAVMMGLTSRQWLENRRIYFWGGFLGLSFLFSFDPTGMAPLILTLTMIGLFEGTLALLRWTGN